MTIDFFNFVISWHIKKRNGGVKPFRFLRVFLYAV